MSVILFFCLQRRCKTFCLRKCLHPCDSACPNAVVQSSVFIDLSSAETVCLNYGLRVWKQTNKMKVFVAFIDS